MIEWAMFFFTGFLFASLLSLGLICLVHERAVRLTSRRLHAAAPMWTSEMRIAQDNLRADFALSVHRLEGRIEQLRFKLSVQLSESGRKAEAISRLRAELAKRTNDADELAKTVLNLTAKSNEVERQRDKNVIAFPPARFCAGQLEPENDGVRGLG